MDYYSIDSAPVVHTLRKLAEQPYDLTKKWAVDAQGRISRYCCDGVGLRLFYATQRLDGRVLDALQLFAEQCGLVEQFKAMRRGAVLNNIKGYPSENRQVLHCSSRDVFDDAPREPVSAKAARDQLEKLSLFLEELENGVLTNHQGQQFRTLINVGIGGSDLGPRACYEALKAYRLPGRDVYFIANADPDDAAAVLDGLDLSTTLVSVVSKSGTTLETLSNEQLVRKRFVAAGLDPARHFVAVTGPQSPMDDCADYLRSWHVFDFVGGRYSTTSMVGAVPLGFALGHEVFCDFLRGAKAMDDCAEHSDIRRNLPLLMALIGVWNRNFLGYPTLAVLPYSQALHRFPGHLQQCDMESNGKSVQRDGQPVTGKTGPILWGEPGSNGQHAFYQFLHQGTEIVPLEFIGFLESQYQQDFQVAGTTSQQKLLANMLAQAIAFAQGSQEQNPNKYFAGNRPSLLLVGKKLDPATMGALLAAYEAKIVFQGFAWNINSFDQEGVQLGKSIATKILRIMNEANGDDDSFEKSLVAAVLTVGGD